MSSVVLIRFLFILLAILPATAEVDFGRFLSADEVRAQLFGVHLSGDVGLERAPWSECIDPEGRTIFTHMGQVRVGQMSVSDDGALCFEYAAERAEGRNCFYVRREGAGYAFHEVSRPGTIFFARHVVRDVETCEVEALRLSERRETAIV